MEAEQLPMGQKLLSRSDLLECVYKMYVYDPMPQSKTPPCK